MLKIFFLLYADDIILFAQSSEELQNSLDTLFEYCQRYKLSVNTSKTKVMVLRKWSVLPSDLKFYYNGKEINIVTTFSYLYVVFSTSGSFSDCQKTPFGQAQKAIFKLNRYLYTFTNITPKHRLELFDKLISPILNYCSEVWVFCQASQVERTHMLFCKQLLGVKTSTQNNFIYGELGRTNYYIRRLFSIIEYWFKAISTKDRKYVKQIHYIMLDDIASNPKVKTGRLWLKTHYLILGFIIFGHLKALGM